MANHEDDGHESDSGRANVNVVKVTKGGIFTNRFITTKDTATDQGGAESIDMKYLRNLEKESNDRNLRMSARRAESIKRIRELSIGGAGADADNVLQDALQKVVNYLRPIDNVRFFTLLNSALDIKEKSPLSNISETVMDYLGFPQNAGTKSNKTIDLYVAIVSNRQSGIESSAVCFFMQEQTSGVTQSSRRIKKQKPLKLITLVNILSDTRIRLQGGGQLVIFTSGKRVELNTISVRSLWGLLNALQNARHHARNHNLYTPITNHQWTKFYQSNDAQLLDDSADDSEPSKQDGDDFEGSHPDISDISGESDYDGEDEGDDKPKKAELIREIRNIILRYDADDLTIQCVVDDLKSRFGDGVVGPRGYSKSFIDRATIQTFGQLEPPSEILDGLFLGTEYNASNYKELKDFGVHLVVNVTEEVDSFFPTVFKYHRISLKDKPTSNLLPYFGEAADRMHETLNNGGGILVHCQRGVSRSASIVIAYIMKYRGLSFKEAFDLVKERRSIIKPNKGFRAQLDEFETQLKESRREQKT